MALTTLGICNSIAVELVGEKQRYAHICMGMDGLEADGARIRRVGPLSCRTVAQPPVGHFLQNFPLLLILTHRTPQKSCLGQGIFATSCVKQISKCMGG